MAYVTLTIRRTLRPAISPPGPDRLWRRRLITAWPHLVVPCNFAIAPLAPFRIGQQEGDRFPPVGATPRPTITLRLFALLIAWRFTHTHQFCFPFRARTLPHNSPHPPLTLNLSLSSARHNYCTNNHLTETTEARGSTSAFVPPTPESANVCHVVTVRTRLPELDKRRRSATFAGSLSGSLSQIAPAAHPLTTHQYRFVHGCDTRV
jgi:hypothetical protein